MEKLQGLAEAFEVAVREMFPGFTDASISVDSDGFVHIDVMQWGEHELGNVNNDTKRRSLLYMSRSGEWLVDYHETMNRYYAESGCLLGEVLK